uniref:Chlorophyll synthase, chloroplastic n=1 Tax=Aegilops tauschii TaxID=37682 RepID=M8CYB3_AEGTA
MATSHFLAAAAATSSSSAAFRPPLRFLSLPPPSLTLSPTKPKVPEKAPAAGSSFNQLLGIKGAKQEDNIWKIRLQLTKPVTWPPLVWGVLCGAAASGNFHWTAEDVAKSIVCMLMSGPCLTGYTQTINDWYDRDIDAINEPYRPIPSGAISENEPVGHDAPTQTPPRFAKIDFATYDGTEDQLNWLNQCEQFFRGQRTLASERTWLASYHLRGAAQTWYYALEQDKGIMPPWERFRELCLLRFGPPIRGSRLAELGCLPFTSTVQDFADRFQALACHASGVTAPQRAHLFVGGLPDHIRVDVELQGPQDIQTAMYYARAFERRAVITQIWVLLLAGLGLGALLDVWAGHDFPIIFYLALGGSLLSYIYSAPPLKLKQNGWIGNFALGASYIGLPWWAGQALFGTLTPDIVVLTTLYSIAGLGIAIVNDFKSIEGDRTLGLQSLPVAFGMETAKWICVGAIDITQLSVAAYLLSTGKLYYALALVGLTIPQVILQMFPLPQNFLFTRSNETSGNHLDDLYYEQQLYLQGLSDCPLALTPSVFVGPNKSSRLSDFSLNRMYIDSPYRNIRFVNGKSNKHEKKTLTVATYVVYILILDSMEQFQYFLKDPVKYDVKYQASAQPFFVFGLLVTALATSH